MTHKDLIKSYLKEVADFQPTWGLSLGIAGTEEKLADYSESRVRLHIEALSTLQRSMGRENKKTNSIGNIEKILLEKELQLRLKDWQDRRTYRRDPTLYIGELIYGLWYLPLRILDRRLQVESALIRLFNADRILESAQKNLKNPPLLWTQMAIEEAKGYLVFLRDVRADLLKKAPSRKSEIERAIDHAEKVGRDFLKFLRGPLRKHSGGDFAVGKSEFEFLLRNYHLYTETAQDLLDLGHEQIALITRQLEEQAKKISKKSDWREIIEKLRRRHPSANRLLSFYQDETTRLRRYIRRKQIVSLPDGERLRIIETPEFTRNTIPYAAYIDPAMFGGKNEGTFFVTPVTTRDAKKRRTMLEEHNTGAMQVTSLHEGYPGHHLQFAKQFHSRGKMMKIYNCSSFYEGWALYCEEMMYEQGYYDEGTRLMQLKDKLWRACRVVVDVGMQLRKMNDRQAVDFLVKKAHLARPSARADVNWYTQRPTIPQSYLTGMLRIKALREKYFHKFPRATLRQFHDQFLQFGAIPIPLVEQILLADY